MAVDHYTLLVRLLPVGDLHNGEGYAQDDLVAMASPLDLLWTQRTELLKQVLPDQAVETLSHWETVYDLHRLGSRTDAERQARLVAARRLLPDFRVATIEDLVEELTTVTATVVEPRAFRCDDPDSLTDTDDDVIDGAHLFWVDQVAVDVRAAGVDRDEVDELLARVKPAHTQGWARYTGSFFTDDPYSLTDRDKLGA